MNIVGVIAEYNPFHNGHLYHLTKIKELYPESIIIVILSGHFMQRGEPSMMNKWDKTEIALQYGADLVIELPFSFASQAADFFAKGAIQLLKHLKADTLVFGSEENEIERLKTLSKIDIKGKKVIKNYLDAGVAFPKAIALYLKTIGEHSNHTPNDILGLAYIKAIQLENARITPVTIKRTNDYHSLELKNNIVSASSIRKALYDGKDVTQYVPPTTNNKFNQSLFFYEAYFPFLQYKIYSELNRLGNYQTVDEGLENKIKKEMIHASSMEDLIHKIKSKRYTYNKIRRMLTHILVGFTKKEAKQFKNIEYIRILGFTKQGQTYLNRIKKEIEIPLLSKFKKGIPMLDLELRATMVYASILKKDERIKLIEQEYHQPPIIKN